jgi:mRNA-degrading endonuclease toxin of MazEF toxin-antitoxin module
MARVLSREIRWADLHATRGHEQAGEGPVLVLSHDVFNDRLGPVIAVALTAQTPRAGFPLTLEAECQAAQALVGEDRPDSHVVDRSTRTCPREELAERCLMVSSR